MRRQVRRKRKQCTFCANKIAHVDYKDIERLEEHISERGKILPRRATGVCTRHQRQLSRAVKNARALALIPFVRQ